MKRNLKQTLTIWGCMAASVGLNVLPLVQPALAETLARAQGRCKLTSQSGTQTFTVFDGHCIVKQKQQGTTTLFVVDLDNGSEFRFFGPNKQALQVETSEGIHNAQFSESPDKGVFAWQEDGDRNRLSVRLDSQQNPNVSHDDAQPPSAETVLGTAIGAAIGNLLTGGRSSTTTSVTPSVPRSVPITPAASTNFALVSKPVEDLQDLVGARGGQAELDVTRRGYQFVRNEADNSDNRVFAFWRQPGTGLCVAIITQEGRYANIVYANVRNQKTCQ